jgi:hypothetical protein
MYIVGIGINPMYMSNPRSYVGIIIDLERAVYIVTTGQASSFRAGYVCVFKLWSVNVFGDEVYV